MRAVFPEEGEDLLSLGAHLLVTATLVPAKRPRLWRTVSVAARPRSGLGHTCFREGLGTRGEGCESTDWAGGETEAPNWTNFFSPSPALRNLAIEYKLKQRIIFIRPSIFRVSESLGQDLLYKKHFLLKDKEPQKAFVYVGHQSVQLLAWLCLTLSTPIDCRPLGSSVHGIFQARILDLVAIFYF